MQFINTIIINSKMEIIHNTEYNFVLIMDLVYGTENYLETYPLLASVDPYDDTIFNRYQLDILTQELDVLLKKHADKEGLSKVLEIVSKVKDLQYLKLKGD